VTPPCSVHPRVVTTLATLLSVSVLAFGIGCGKKQEGAPGGGGFEMPPTPVEAATVEVRTVSDRFEAVGTIEAGNAITVVAEIDGIVTSLPFKEGSRVAKGDLLAQFDDVQTRADVARSEALRDQAKSRFDRIKSVVDQGAGTAQDMDDAAADLKVAEADMALARDRLSKTRITAPWAGFVGARRPSPGAYLRAGESITDLADVSSLRVNFSAPERHLRNLVRGSQVEVTTPAFPGISIAGQIDVVEPVIDASTRSARIVARVDNPNDELRPGMSCNVAAVLAERDSALTVPNQAVLVEGTEFFVYVIGPDGTVGRAAVVLGTRTSDLVEVRSGLTAGQQVVTAGHQKIYPGAKVMAMPAGGMPAGGPPGGAPGGAPAAEAEAGGGGSEKSAGH